MSLDVFLALFIPLLILFMAFRVFPTLKWSDITFLFSPFPKDTIGMYSPQNAYHSYKRYRNMAGKELAQMRASYGTLGRAHKRIGYTIGYPSKLNQLQEVTEANAQVTDAIARLAASQNELEEWPARLINVGSADLARVREALRHFVRDWSTEGAEERSRIFSPILDILRQCPSGSVLLPGSGLGRLGWEISQLGFAATAVEFSSYMTFALRLVLQSSRTNAYTVHPYAHWFSHQRTNESLFRSVTFPDVLPRLGPHFNLVEGDFFKLPVTKKYDYIVTLFFIDTSVNVFATLERIHDLLADGGTWINLGPLLWTSGGTAKVELSLEEVVQAAREIGFEFVDGPRTVECEYTSDRNAMMQWIYKAELWTAKKVSEVE